MIASCLCEEEVTRTDIREGCTTRGSYQVGSVGESDREANMAMNLPLEEDLRAGFGKSVGCH